MTTTDIQLVQQAALVVPRDRVVATLRVMARGANARQIQIDINHRMMAALAKVKNAPAVTAETGSYSVNTLYLPGRVGRMAGRAGVDPQLRRFRRGAGAGGHPAE